MTLLSLRTAHCKMRKAARGVNPKNTHKELTNFHKEMIKTDVTTGLAHFAVGGWLRWLSAFCGGAGLGVGQVIQFSNRGVSDVRCTSAGVLFIGNTKCAVFHWYRNDATRKRAIDFPAVASQGGYVTRNPASDTPGHPPESQTQTRFVMSYAGRVNGAQTASGRHHPPLRAPLR